jgi:hypothetical protein
MGNAHICTKSIMAADKLKENLAARANAFGVQGYTSPGRVKFL